MTNKELANQFNGLAKIMELYGENPFKIRSYSSAYINIRKQAEPLFEKSKEELLQVPGIGQAIADKIVELRETGQMKALNKYLEKTPPGIVELMEVKGFGPKKVKAVWDELGIESPGELLYACHENRLIDLKGFGVKTQMSLIQQLTYFLDSRGKYLYGHIIEESLELLDLLKKAFDYGLFDFTRGLQRKMPIVDGIEIITNVNKEEIELWLSKFPDTEFVEGLYFYKGSKIIFYAVQNDVYFNELFLNSGSEEFISAWTSELAIPEEGGSSTSSFEKLSIAFIPPETRESASIISKAKIQTDLDIIDYEDIKGVVHAHTTYSDGSNTLVDMAHACEQKGFQYLAISDHSKAAFYANGLNEDRVLAQISEIEKLNNTNTKFKIFKGIECDILYSGELDYEDNFLEVFDFVIISVHSNLKMDKEKATSRLLKAIEHPASTILGHPTGRLLLSREGYPIDHKKIIEACAQNRVSIEINASPYRLDLDWQWINYAREKEVLLSINPDAHSIAGINDIRFGIDAARKAGLTSSECLNTKDVVAFGQWINQ